MGKADPLLLPGARFGKLTVQSHERGSNPVCMCDCGKEARPTAYDLKRGHTTSCGCWRQHNPHHLRWQRQDIVTGARFSRLMVLARNGQDVLCQCDCGAEITVKRTHLVNGHTQSCGCLQREAVERTFLRHGAARQGRPTGTYLSWAGMLQRCLNSKNPNWKDYGGRGITVCPEWMEFEAFRRDMGERPEGYTIERIDNDGPYSKANCRWATRKEQGQNRRPRLKRIVNGL